VEDERDAGRGASDVPSEIGLTLLTFCTISPSLIDLFFIDSIELG
jgi:hypothetical protein